MAQLILRYGFLLALVAIVLGFFGLQFLGTQSEAAEGPVRIDAGRDVQSRAEAGSQSVVGNTETVSVTASNDGAQDAAPQPTPSTRPAAAASITAGRVM